MKRKLKDFLDKEVVIRFLENDTGREITTTGILTDFYEANDEEDLDKEFVSIQNDTDYDRIPLKDVRKIFLKKEE